jgi:hypothetical protein
MAQVALIFLMVAIVLAIHAKAELLSVGPQVKNYFRIQIQVLIYF